MVPNKASSPAPPIPDLQARSAFSVCAPQGALSVHPRVGLRTLHSPAAATGQDPPGVETQLHPQCNGGRTPRLPSPLRTLLNSRRRLLPRHFLPVPSQGAWVSPNAETEV